LAIDINIAIFVSISIPVLGIMGLLNQSKIFALFPFMGAVMGGIIYEYLATDGQIAVAGTNYSDYPFILVPLFLTFGDLAFTMYKAAPSSKILETLTLIIIAAGIDGYFVPTLLSNYATDANPNLPAAMLPFVQQYGEIFTVGVSAVLVIYALYSIWFK